MVVLFYSTNIYSYCLFMVYKFISCLLVFACTWCLSVTIQLLSVRRYILNAITCDKVYQWQFNSCLGGGALNTKCIKFISDTSNPVCYWEVHSIQNVLNLSVTLQILSAIGRCTQYNHIDKVHQWLVEVSCPLDQVSSIHIILYWRQRHTGTCTG